MDDPTQEQLDEMRRRDQEAARRSRLVADGNAAALDEEARVAALDEAEQEAAAIAASGPVEVRLSDGTTITVAEPRALGWVSAVARIQSAAGPIAKAVLFVREAGADGMLDTDDGRMAMAGRVLSGLGEDPERTEQVLRRLLLAIDALMGRPDGWSGDLPLPDVMAVLTGLIRAIRPERYAVFFASIRAAMGAAARMS
jgi:hypothetical protein